MNHWSTEPQLSSTALGVSLLLETHHDWGCFCQAGDNGIVLTQKEPYSYKTAFFEAFPRTPDTFIRGEGSDIIQAEEDAWKQFEKIRNCPGHEFERRKHRNGGGFCKHCGLFSMVFEPLEKCCICGVPTYNTYDVDNNWYCPEHMADKPPAKYHPWDWSFAYDENEMWDWEHKEENKDIVEEISDDKKV